jgi:hypothetical protein
MGRHFDDRNEFGGKQLVRIKINGTFIDRSFPNEGKARKFLEDSGYSKDDLKKGVVKIVHN